MLGWNDFFDLNDSAPIDDAVAKIEKLEKTYVRMIDAVEASNARLADELGQVTAEADDLVKSVSKMNIVLEQNQKQLGEAAGQSENLVKEYGALKTVQADNLKTVSSLSTQLEVLTQAKEKLKKTTENEAGSLDDLRTRLAEAEKAYKAMGASADQTIKDEQLDKVRGLANEYKNANQALSDAKKGATVAAGSYNELSTRVAAAKKQLREMEGGLEGNSREFKELQKFAKEGTDTLKDWDEAVGDSTRNVGGYQGAIVGAVQQLKAIPGAAGAADKALKILSSNPVIFTLLAIGAAVGALTRYFKSSAEGQDDFNTVLAYGAEILDMLLDVVEALGKALFTAITEPKKVWQEFMKLVEPLGAMITKAFDDPVQALKDFGTAIYENVVKRFEGLGKIFMSLDKIIRSGFTDGFKDLSNAVIQAATGVEDGVDKIIKALEPLQAELDKRAARAKAIADLENKLMKDRIADITDDAQTELAVNKLILESKDKLRFSDEERFNKLRQANKLLEEQLKGDLELQRDEIKLQELLIERDGATYEARQKLAELQAKEIGLQSEFVKARKKRQAEEISLIREIEKEIVDSQKRIADANKAVNTVRLNDVIKTNQRILADENSSLEARLQAIVENDAAQNQLLIQERDAQLAAIKETGLARIELSAEMTDQIYNNEALSIQERIQLERDAKAELLATDEAYIAETLKVTEDFTSKTNDLLETSKNLAEDNVFKTLQRDAEILSAQVNTKVNEDLKALNEAFVSGDISTVKEFEEKKLQIQEDAQRESIASQINFLKEKASMLETGSKAQVDALEKVSQLELQLAQMTSEEVIKTEREKQEALKELKDFAINSALESLANFNEAADIAREEELAKLEAQFELEQELLGNNEQAKAQLKNEFEAKKKKLEAEQVAANRKRAIFEKALAVTEIAINTAKGVGLALGSFPPPASFILAALVGVLGAVQIASVISKPIPTFAEGTEDAPGGWSIINELGPEMIEDRQGNRKIINTDGPTLAYLPPHAKVYTAEETERLQEHEHFENQVGVLRNGMNTVLESNEKEFGKELVDTMNRRFLSLENTVRTKPAFSLNIDKAGVKMLLQNAETTTEFLDKYFN